MTRMSDGLHNGLVDAFAAIRALVGPSGLHLILEDGVTAFAACFEVPVAAGRLFRFCFEHHSPSLIVHS